MYVYIYIFRHKYKFKKIRIKSRPPGSRRATLSHRDSKGWAVPLCISIVDVLLHTSKVIWKRRGNCMQQLVQRAICRTALIVASQSASNFYDMYCCES